MDYLKKHFKLVSAILFIIITAIFFVAVYKLKFKKDFPQLEVIKTEVAFKDNPQLFPEDVPIEKGATIIQNYNSTTNNGRFQATRVFETTKSLDENLKIYQDYFKSSGWTVSAVLDEPNIKMISGTKDSYDLNVTINVNTVTDIKTVDISLTKFPN